MMTNSLFTDNQLLTTLNKMELFSKNRVAIGFPRIGGMNNLTMKTFPQDTPVQLTIGMVVNTTCLIEPTANSMLVTRTGMTIKLLYQ